MTEQQPPTPNEGWDIAIKLAGGGRALARRLKCDSSNIYRFVSGELHTSLKWAVRLEREMGIPRHLTRPDVFRKPGRGA